MMLLVMATMMATAGAWAQKETPAGIRMESIEVEKNNARYTVFTYKDEDGAFGYYMSLGGSGQIFSISDGGNTVFSVEDARETCLLLGKTVDEAFGTLDTLMAMFEKEAGTTRVFKGRTTDGGERLAGQNPATCKVQKRPFGGKRLLFRFTSGNRQCGVYLTKGVVKQLRWGLKTDVKLHPKMHK